MIQTHSSTGIAQNPLLVFVFFLCCGAFFSCKPKTDSVKSKPVELVREFKNTGNWDSVYLYTDGHLVIIQKKDTVKSQRFFLISYQYALKEFTGTFNGDVWFSSDNFPSKKEIDSLVYDGLPNKKSCYQPILISSIFEFKNEDDFLRFDNNYVGNRSSNRKVSCW
jgi:hypothetical protein